MTASSLDEMRDLGLSLRRLRERTGSTAKEWGDLLGWAPDRVSRIEHGKRLPSSSDLVAITKIAPVDAKEDVDEIWAQFAEVREARAEHRRRSSPVVRGGVVQVEPDADRSEVMAEYYRIAEGEVARLLRHARGHLRWYQAFRIGALVFTAITPVLAALSAPAAVTAAAGFLALLSTGVVQLTQLNGLAVVDQQQASALGREVRLYKAGGQEYSEATADALLIQRVEEIRARGASERISVIQQSFTATVDLRQ